MKDPERSVTPGFLFLGETGIDMFEFGWIYDVEIFEPRGNGMYITRDKGKLVTREGTMLFSLRKEKVRTKPINPKYIYINNKKKMIL